MSDDITNRIAHVISRCYHDDPWAIAVAVVEELGLTRIGGRLVITNPDIQDAALAEALRSDGNPAPPAR
jgi:hypothetical protein